MKKREELIKNIIENYNQKNKNNSRKINLENPAKDNENPFLKEFKTEINKSIFKREKEKHQNTMENQNIDIIEEENNELDFINNDHLDKDIINKIKIETKKILNNIKIGLLIYKKTELKKIIFDDIIKDLIDFNLTDIKKQKINELINILIEQEIKIYFSNDNNRKNKEILKYFLKNIYPEINEFYKKNEYEKINMLSISQKKFLINSFIEYLETKYLKKEIKKNNITQNEYNFLKSQINLYISKQEKNYKEISIIKKLNKKK